MTDNDIWIETTSPVPAKYCAVQTLVYPFGHNGPAEARVRFNLSAYVRDEIERALDTPSQITPNQAGS